MYTNIILYFQEKITKLYYKMRREGLNTVASIERKKEFRNPRYAILALICFFVFLILSFCQYSKTNAWMLLVQM